MKGGYEALILAAGFGERLKTLTERIPKPLIPIADIPLISFTLYNLKRHGIKKLLINLHWKGGMIKGLLADGRKLGLEIDYLDEKEIMGTGGTVKYASKFFADDIIIANADTICDVDIRALLAEHKSSGAIATLALAERKGEHKKLTPVNVQDGFIEGIGEGDFFFCGVHIAKKEIAKILPKKIPSCIVEDGYKKILKENKYKGKYKLRAYIHKGCFWDVGTYETLEFLINNPKVIPNIDEVRKLW